jgi:hypothetical protein
MTDPHPYAKGTRRRAQHDSDMRDIVIDGLAERHTALLAALDALVENWRQREQQYRNVRPHDEATADTLRGCAKELAMTTFSVACADHDHPVCERLGCQCLCHRHAALLAALDGWVQELRDYVNNPPTHEGAERDVQMARVFANRLAAALATHREAR